MLSNIYIVIYYAIYICLKKGDITSVFRLYCVFEV